MEDRQPAIDTGCDESPELAPGTPDRHQPSLVAIYGPLPAGPDLRIVQLSKH